MNSPLATKWLKRDSNSESERTLEWVSVEVWVSVKVWVSVEVWVLEEPWGGVKQLVVEDLN